jgi:hypothetical protein
MTDAPPETPAPLRVFTCYDPRHDDRSCYLLVEDAEEPRRKHREWHAAEIAVREGQRKAIKARDDEIAALRVQLARVKAPATHVPLEIDRGGYTDAELDEEPAVPSWARYELDEDPAPAPAAPAPADDDEDDVPDVDVYDDEDEPVESARTSWSR